MIAVQLGQTSSTSSLAGQCMCLHADHLRSPMNGQPLTKIRLHPVNHYQLSFLMPID